MELLFWARGKPMAWDLTVPDTYAESPITIHEHVSSVQFSKDICIVQLSRMSHCAPAARKPVRFKFTPEARVGHVLVA